MVKYLVDRMIIADSRFDEAVSMRSESVDIIIVEEVLHESRSDSRHESLKKYSTDVITREHIDILKHRVVNEMVSCGSLLPDEGTGETMIAAEYWCKNIGTQASLFDVVDDAGKIVVTNDNKALDFFNKNKISTMQSDEFFEKIKSINPEKMNSKSNDINKKGKTA